jgi:hypothetical protein
MRQAHAIQVIYSDGLIEKIDSGIIIAETQDGMFYEAMNILPDKQLLLVAISLHSMLKELNLEDDEWDFPKEVLNFIRQLMNPIEEVQTNTKQKVELQ